MAIASDSDGSLILSFAGLANDRAEEVENDNNNNSLNYGGGILLEAGVNDHFGVETGALLVKRQYEVEQGSSKFITEVDRLHIPVTARIWFFDFLSLAAGPFVAFNTGDQEVTFESNGNQLATTSSSAEDNLEFGLDGALTFNLAVADKTGLFIEGRYSHILDQEDGEEADQVTGLAGLKIDI